VDAFPGKSGQTLSSSIGRRDLFMILKSEDTLDLAVLA
jgi:hypothetical protein